MHDDAALTQQADEAPDHHGRGGHGDREGHRGAGIVVDGAGPGEHAGSEEQEREYDTCAAPNVLVAARGHEGDDEREPLEEQREGAGAVARRGRDRDEHRRE